MQDERPPYPEGKKCNRCPESEWEWQFENVWTCLGCGFMFEQEIAQEKKEEVKAPQKGDTVSKKVSGAGVVTYEEGVIFSVDKKEVWLDNGPGNDPSGPFDPKTGRDLRNLPFLGLTTSVVFDGGEAARGYENRREEE